MLTSGFSLAQRYVYLSLTTTAIKALKCKPLAQYAGVVGMKYNTDQWKGKRQPWVFFGWNTMCLWAEVQGTTATALASANRTLEDRVYI